MGERHFRRVGRTADHRFAEKRAAERNPVKSADKIAASVRIAVPAFDAVRVADGVERGITALDLAANPRRWAVGRGFGAQGDDAAEGAVGGDDEAVGGERFPERARGPEAVEREDRPAFGLDPEHLFVVTIVGHREDAHRISAQQQIGSERHSARLPTWPGDRND